MTTFASVTAVLKVMIIEAKPVLSMCMMVRGENFWPVIALKVCNILGCLSFLRSNLRLADFFQTKVEVHHQQVVVTSVV